MIEISVNGEPVMVASATTVASMLTANGFDCSRVAVAINSEFVARSAYDKTQFSAGDNVDVVAPMAGG